MHVLNSYESGKWDTWVTLLDRIWLWKARGEVGSSHMYQSISIYISLCPPFFTIFSSEWGCASWLNVSHHPMPWHFEWVSRVGGDIASWRWNPPVDMLQTSGDWGHKSRYLCLESLVQMNESTTMCSYTIFNSTWPWCTKVELCAWHLPVGQWVRWVLPKILGTTTVPGLNFLSTDLKEYWLSSCWPCTFNATVAK